MEVTAVGNNQQGIRWWSKRYGLNVPLLKKKVSFLYEMKTYTKLEKSRNVFKEILREEVKINCTLLALTMQNAWC